MTTAVGRESGLRISFCRDEEVPALMRFIGDHWRAGHILSRDQALLRWQFAPARMRGRAATGPTVLLGWVDDTIVGMLGLTGFDFNAAGNRLSAAWMSHWFALEAHRRQAVALRLLWAAQDCGVEVLATLGANRVADALLGRLGMARIRGLTRWVGVFDPTVAAELVRAASPRGALGDPTQFAQAHSVRETHSSPAGIRCVEWSDALAELWDRCWSDTFAPRLAGACRDASYVRWRYSTHPRFPYVIRVAQDREGAIKGLAVWRVEQVRGGPPARVLRVVEFLATAAGAPGLVEAIVAAGQGENIAMADFHCSSSRIAEPLAAVGFRPQAGDPTVTSLVFPSRLQPLEPGGHQLLPLVRLPPAHQGALDGELYMTSSDCDQDRPN